MKILLLNAHSPRNAGDLAILEESLACLQNAYPHARVTVAINDTGDSLLPTSAEYAHSLTRWLVSLGDGGTWQWHKQRAPFLALWLFAAAFAYRLFGLKLRRRRVEQARLLKAYYEADLVAVIGGGHLYAPHAFNIAFLWLWLGLALAVVMGKPLALLPQSFGPLPGRLQRTMLRWLIDRSAFVAAREFHSLQMLAEIGVRSRVFVLPDLAFCTAAAPLAEVDMLLPELIAARQSGRPLVGITLMDWGGQNTRFRNQTQYEAAMVALIHDLIDQYGAHVALFAQCTGPTPNQDDRFIAARIAEAFPSEALIRADRVLTPSQLKAAYGQLDALVATRMHSAIFALSCHVPTIAIGYLHKSAGIMEMLGLTRYTLDINDINTKTCQHTFRQLWENRAVIKSQLTMRIPAIQTTLSRLPMLLRSAVGELQ